MGNKQHPSASAVAGGDVSQQQQTEYDVTRLIHLARLLTSDPTSDNDGMVSVQSLMNLPLISCDAYAGPYVTLAESMRSVPPTYQGEDPIADITTVLSQLISCVKATRSVGTKIEDFFKGNDGGAKLRQLLLLSKTVIECLALWHGMEKAGILNDPNSEDFRSMQELCRQALTLSGTIPIGLTGVDPALIPASIRQDVIRAHEWNGQLSTVAETFSLAEGQAPVLLIFNEEALQAAMNATEQNGSLPPQVHLETSGSQDDGSTASGDIMPVTFIKRANLKPFVEKYLESGPVATAPYQ